MSKLTKALTAAAGNAGGDNLYVEDVFSTYLYTGDGTTNPFPIVNGIDLANEGGLVWHKQRSSAAQSHVLVDTERGGSSFLSTNSTSAATGIDIIDSFNENGFDLALNSITNTSAKTYASWTFRKAEKFFDVVTYTGDGVSGRTVAHNLGSVPAVMFIKRTSASGDDWAVYHSSLGATQLLALNTTAASLGNPWLTNTAPTDSVFTLNNYGFINASGSTYVAYLFASDAGGFGDDGDESIIKCGSYTGNGSTDGPEIDLGFEPQWLMIKRTDDGSAGMNWFIFDHMRGMPVGGADQYVSANLSDAEAGSSERFKINATGFKLATSSGSFNASSGNYIYIAIRRPMKTPESGTEVFAADFRGSTQATAAGVVSYSGFPVDLTIQLERASDASTGSFVDRLRNNQWLKPDSTAAETPVIGGFDTMNGWWNGTLSSNTTIMALMFKRATGFFDVVAYTGDGVAGLTIDHNLGVKPELMIVKGRNNAFDWNVYVEDLGFADYMELNKTNANSTHGNVIWHAEPTASSFSVGTNVQVNQSTYNYIAYLFATLAGVSKVGSYTGTGADLNVDCGFSAGARFVLIKRSDSTGDWYVWDSERGIVAGNDPYLLLNSTAAEVTSTDYIDPLASGFTVTSSAPAALNASGGTYIFLAIA